MSCASKRQRTENMTGASRTGHMDPLGLQRGSRGGGSAVGDTLRMNVLSRLNPTEAEIMGIMLEAVKLSKSGTVVRVAGGWVRDKLLGLEAMASPMKDMVVDAAQLPVVYVNLATSTAMSFIGDAIAFHRTCSRSTWAATPRLNEDIDFALDNCTGVAFAEMVNTYLKSKGQDEGKVAVIEANPEQSKHLETARMKVMGVWIDLVNLRTEVYRSDSRIPEASFGTAEEDALRRDFTLNALFYNLNEGKVEDKTGRGVDDLRDGIISTPLPPMTTFQDDPLRVLRAVRFAARFGFTLHEDLRAAAQDKIIQTALRTKVSPERVGAELSGMITGKMAQPAVALSMLQELGLAQAVYAPPEHLVPPPPIGGLDWARGAAVARAAARLLTFRSSVTEMGGGGNAQPVDETLHRGQAGVNGNEKANAAAPGGEGRERKGGDGRFGDGTKQETPATLVRELFLCAALLPLAGVKQKAKKGKLVSAAQSIVSDSLKLKTKEAKNVGDILELLQTFRLLADANITTSGDADAIVAKVNEEDRASKIEFSRLSVGLALRQAKELWSTCVDLCCAEDICDIRQPRPLLSSTRPPPTGADATAASAARHQEQATLDDGALTSSADGDIGVANVDTEWLEGGKEHSVMAKYARFREAVASMGLERAWDMAPLIRGNGLMEELQLPKGPEIGKQMAKQISWQLEHPEGTREQCLAFLRGMISKEYYV